MFDKAVDVSVVGTNCNKLFTFVSRLGTNYVADWQDGYTKCILTLGDDANFPEGEEISIDPAYLQSTSTYAWTDVEVNVLVLEVVADMPNPRVLIKAPRTCSTNFDLILDASLSAGGQF